MALKLANNATSRLAGAITNAQTTLSVTPGTGARFPTLAGGDWHPLTVLKADGSLEIMRVTARSTDTLTVTRGQEGTAAIAFSADDRVELRLTKAVLDYMYSPDNDGASKGDRNRVINGSCQIVNVATFVAANNTNGYGGPEMFYAQNAGAGGQFTQSQGSVSFGGLTLKTVRQTVNTALTSLATGNYWFGIDQRVEGFNAFDLRGKPVALSFVFNTNVSGTYSVAVRDRDGTQSYVTTITAVANTPQQISIPLAAIPSAADVPNTNEIGLRINVGALNTGTFQTATLNQWQSGNFFSASGATNWGAAVDNFIELTNLQLEEGTVATPFIRRSYQQELALTQRYYEHSYGIGVNPGSSVEDNAAIGIATSTTRLSCFVSYKVIKRARPTITSYGTGGGVGEYSLTNNLGAGVGTLSVADNHQDISGFQEARVTNATAGTHYQFHWTASARL